MLKYFTTIFFLCAVVCPSLAQQKEIDSLEKALPLLHNTSRIDCLLKISFGYGHVNNDSDNVHTPVNSDSATFYASVALKDAQKINYQKGIADAYENLGEMAHTYNFHDGENYFRQAIALYKDIHDAENLYWSYLWLGYYLMWECKFEEARQAFSFSLPYYKKVNNQARQGRIYGLFAKSYILEGYYKKAFEYALKDINIIKNKIRYQNDPINAWSRMGDLYQFAGDITTAITYYELSAKHSKAYNKESYNETETQINNLKKNYDSALYYSKLNDSSKDNITIGEIYFLQSKYDKALPYFLSHLEKVKQKGNTYQQMDLLDDIAKDYHYQKKINAAIFYASDLLNTANSTHARQFIKDGNWLLWKIYDQQKNTDSAYKYRLQFDNINDSIEQDKLLRDIAVARMKFDDEQKQSQINLLKKDNQLEQQQLKTELTKRNILMVRMAFVALLAIILFRNFALKRKNEKLDNDKKQSELKNRATELEMQALRAQMNPHFIFNCLSSINSFILKSKMEEASKFLTKFSRLIRMVLNNSKEAFISLEDELVTLRLYLDMEKLRFKNSFDYEFNFKNVVETENIFIPPLLLQPFAENAIWHGLMHKQEKGFLNFDFGTEEKILTCIITDNGVGREQAEILKSKSVENQKSFGLKITTDRLSLLNNSSNGQTFFTIEDLKDKRGKVSGTRVQLKIYYKMLYEI